MNTEYARTLATHARIEFVRSYIQNLIFTEDSFDGGHDELFTILELKNALRSSDIWIDGSRQHKGPRQISGPVRSSHSAQDCQPLFQHL
jgi:hypothetical protein